jgi:hypothetical protein
MLNITVDGAAGQSSTQAVGLRLDWEFPIMYQSLVIVSWIPMHRRLRSDIPRVSPRGCFSGCFQRPRGFAAFGV